MKIIEFVSYLMVPLLMFSIVLFGTAKKKSVYEDFIEGAKEGLQVILRIFPTMIAVILAINLFKISGAMELLVKLVTPIISVLKIPPDVIPLGMMRSVSGGGALAVLSDTLKENGPDSLIGRIASTIMGASDTTLYVLAIYTGAVGIKKTKGALWIGLLCDFIAFMIAVFLYLR